MSIFHAHEHQFRAAMITVVLGALIACLALLASGRPALALEVIEVNASDRVIELTQRADLYSQRADSLPVETAPNADGAIGRMVVRSITPGTNPNWAVFALQNTTRRPIERWITAERYRLIGSRIVFPDLDSARLSRLTPSIGFVPERVPNDDADIFRVTLPPNQTTTFVAELASERFPRMQLWEPRAYQAEKTDAALFNGVMLGAVTLLSLFLTAIFAANQRLMFPMAACVTWAVTAYMCVDFGYWHRLFQVDPGDLSFFRAGAEAAIALGLVGFLFAFLRISHWHTWLRALYGLWILAQVGIFAMALLDPKFGVTLARLSFVLIAVIGTLTIAYLALRGQDRALALVPPWLFLLVWIFGMAAALNGRLSSELVAPSLMAGLTLIMVMLTYTVAQFAFGPGQQVQAVATGALEERTLAIDAAQAGYWEWNARRDEIRTSANVESALELHSGELNTRAADWLAHVHPGDRDKFRVMLAGLEDQGGGRAELALRLRKADNTYRWFELKAGTFQDPSSRSLKAVGLMRDITDERRGRDRLLHDAVHDHLTGLPNRELFMDRLGTALLNDADAPAGRPTVLLIDIDRFKNINSSFGLVVGDSMLLTAARRLMRHLRQGDTLARISGDQFAVLLRQTTELREVALLAERCRRSLRAPMTLAGQEIVLTCSIGATRYDGTQTEAVDLLREAENALYRAKHAGADRTEIFKATMRGEADDRVVLEAELRRAIQDRRFHLVYQPIVALATSELVGFEALLRWKNPRLGLLTPDSFVPLAEDIDLIAPLGAQVIEMATEELAGWHKLLKRANDPLFVSINISTKQLLRPDLLQDLRAILRRETVPPQCLKVEVTESVVMGDPERAIDVIQKLRDAGAGIALDDFGTGFSSLAYLHQFTFDTIKIDKILITGIAASDGAASIVRSILAMAKELKRDVVAEGVETYEDAMLLRTLGCQMAQGFYFSRPLESDAVVSLLQSVAKEERRTGRGSVFGRLLARTRRDKNRGTATKSQAPAQEAVDDALQETADAQVALDAQDDVQNGVESQARADAEMTVAHGEIDAAIAPPGSDRVRMRRANPVSEPGSNSDPGPNSDDGTDGGKADINTTIPVPAAGPVRTSAPPPSASRAPAATKASSGAAGPRAGKAPSPLRSNGASLITPPPRASQPAHSESAAEGASTGATPGAHNQSASATASPPPQPSTSGKGAASAIRQVSALASSLLSRTERASPDSPPNGTRENGLVETETSNAGDTGAPAPSPLVKATKSPPPDPSEPKVK